VCALTAGGAPLDLLQLGVAQAPLHPLNDLRVPLLLPHVKLLRGLIIKQRREAVEAKNQADALIHSTEKAMSEHGDKVDASQKTAIEAAIASLKEAVKGDDAEDIKAKTNTLAQASMKLGEAMYKAQQAEGGEAAAAGGEAPKADDNVVDADFEEVDDNKKGAA